jgi:hypothetical protein
MSYTQKAIAAASALLMGSSAVAAPLVLEGNYVKIGTNDAGTIGSGGNTSPGIQYDSTGTATFNPAYDYLTPGSPFEGWTVKGIDSDGTSVLFNYTNNNTNVGSPNISGTLVDYSGVSYRGLTFDNRAVWSGSVTEFDIEHDYRFNDNQQFVDINTRLEFKINVPTLYFGRFTDPDARAAAGDSSSTLNVRGYAGGVPETNVVLSEALASKYALGLFTSASNSNTGISAGWTTDPIDYYNGVNDGDGDYTIGMAFMFSGISAGDIVNIQYAYIFGPSSYDAAAGAVAGGAGGATASSFTVSDVGSASAPTTSAPTVTGTSTTDVVTTSTSTVTRTETSTDTDGNPVVKTYTDTVLTTTTTPVTTTTYSDGSTTTSNGTPTSTSAVTGTTLGSTAVTGTVVTSSDSTANTTATRTVTRTVESTDADGNPVVRTYTDTILDTTPVTTTTTTSTPVTTTVNADGTTTTSEGTSTSTSSSSTGTTSSSVIATSLNSTAVTRPSVVTSDAPTAGLPVVKVTLTEHKASEDDGVQEIARKHTTTTTTGMTKTVVTTPVTTTTTAEGVETVTEGTSTTTYEFWNDVNISIARDSLFGRVDQHEVLDQVGGAINGTLNHEPDESEEPVRVFNKNYLGWSTLDNGYTAKSRVFGGGLEIDIKPTWTIGAQYNNVSVDLDGSDSTSKLRKQHYGFFNMLRGNTLSLATNVGFAQNRYYVERNVQGVFNNESSTDGNEWWVNNRVYWHATKWLSPFAGYTYGKYHRNGFVESGSIQSARRVDAVDSTSHTGEFGLSASTRFGGKKGQLFGVNVSGTYATDNSLEVAGGVDVAETVFVEGVHQISDGVRNNMVSAKVKFRF